MKHRRWMQLSAIHLWETVLVKAADSQGSPHHLTLAALEPPFQSLFFFSNPPLMPRQNHWQGTARVNTERSNEILVPWSPALLNSVECGQQMVMTDSSLSMRKSCRIILSVTAWISYTGNAKAPSHMNSLGKSPHLDLVAPSEFPKL